MSIYEKAIVTIKALVTILVTVLVVIGAGVAFVQITNLPLKRLFSRPKNINPRVYAAKH